MSFRKLFASVLALSLSTVICFAAEPAGKDAAPAKPKVTISKETTYITQPLRADGYPDYATALNERMSAGVTPENNAAVLLQQAFGPNEIPKELRANYFKLLGIPELPEQGSYFVTRDEMIKRWRVDHPRAADEHDDEKLDEQFDQPCQRPWTEKEFPIVAEWLKINERPLQLAMEASRRSKRYFPVMPPKDFSLIQSPLDHVQQLRDLALLMVTSAMLDVQYNKIDEAWRKLVACHKLARLSAANEWSFVGTIVTYAMEGIAIPGDVALLHYCKPSPQQIKKMRAELKALPPMASPSNSLDLGERFMFLDTVQQVARDGVDAFNALRGEPKGSKSAESTRMRDDMKVVDWNIPLKAGNEWYDKLVAGSRIADRNERQKTLGQLDANLLKQIKGAGSVRSLAIDFLTKKNPQELISPRVSNVFLALMLPAVSAAMQAHDRVVLWDELDDVAFALAEFSAERGEYPETLSALVPKHLAKVPDDVFKKSPGPIGYRRDGSSYVIWTAWLDGEDGGGQHFDDGEADDLALRPGPVPADKAK